MASNYQAGGLPGRISKEFGDGHLQRGRRSLKGGHGGRIFTALDLADGSFDLSGYINPVDAILAIVTRHPMRQEELERSLLHWSPMQVNTVLADLEASGRAQTVERYVAFLLSG